MAKKGVPKRDGSGGGTRANKGRGGCVDPKSTGKGKGGRATGGGRANRRK